jgi:ribosomal protein S18 acetylase RimI-like enzyme
MPPTPAAYSLREAEKEDRTLIQRFVQSPAYTHRHLDWRDPLDWIGRQPFWILEKNGEIEAVMACLAEPEEVAWLRLFAVENRLSPAWAWNILFERVYNFLSELENRPSIVSLGLQDWFVDLLVANGFQHFQDIIVLSFDDAPPPLLAPDPVFTLRPMQKSDLAEVTRIDNIAFESIWRLSLDDMQRAYDRSTYKTVLELNGVVAGYQMSAHNGFSAHLARLAVDPSLQRRRIGYRLVQDVLRHFIHGHGAWGVTLNTQDNNFASLALYRQIGFRLTGEKFPVYAYPYRDTLA